MSLGEAQLKMQLDSTGKVVKVFGQDVTRGRGATARWRGPVCWDCFAYLFLSSFFFLLFFFPFFFFYFIFGKIHVSQECPGATSIAGNGCT